MRNLAGIILLIWPLLHLSEDGKSHHQKWQPSLESISKHETPGWLIDAKIGIQFVGEPMEFDDELWYHWSRSSQRARQLGFDESDEALYRHKDEVKVVGGIPYVWDLKPTGDPWGTRDMWIGGITG
jgi:hypothetical protein